jgi:hypothetical protein
MLNPQKQHDKDDTLHMHHICVYMNVSKDFLGSLTLEYQDEEWVQTIDYEHIPFHCRKCHEHGHLFRDCPLNVPPRPMAEEKLKDGFTQVSGRKKKNPKKPSQGMGKNISTRNSFDVLNQLPESEEVENPHQQDNQHNDKGKSKQTQDPVLEQIVPPKSPTQMDAQPLCIGGGDT